MIDHAVHAEDQPDPLDDLLADFFDWSDRTRSVDVDAFLATAGDSADRRLAERLRSYVETADPIEELAALTTASWIDGNDSNAAVTAVARPREQAAPLRTLPADFGEYELIEEIGRGGMGVVYKARHKPLDRVVCLKMILLGQTAGEREIERFRGEARAMAGLRHPNLVTVHEVGRQASQDYFSMEFVPGETLADRARRQPLLPTEAARYLQATARAIHFAHERQILHRDLKPANVLIDPFDQPRVTDFGLAAHIDAGSLTTTGMVLGTPAYMAPEQTHGDPQRLDVRTDVYGLGATLYEAITGRPPFSGETPLDILLAVRQQDPPAPSLLRGGVPRDLETICLKCLEKSPAQRYTSAAALADDLERYLRREPIRARPISQPQRFARWCRRNPVASATGAVVALSLICVMIVAFVAYRTTASALVDSRKARNEQTRLASQLLQERNAAENHLYLAQIHRIRQTIDNGDLAEAERLLQQLVPTSDETDRRGWEWQYLNGLVRQYERSLIGHEGLVHAVAWSPDGQRLASVGDDRTLRAWDAETGGELWSIGFRSARAIDVAWSPDGEGIATAVLDGTVQIREAESGKLLQHIRDAAATPRTLAWSPSGNRLAIAYDDGRIALSNPHNAKVERALTGHVQRVNSVAWDHRGKWMATGSDDGAVRFWNPADGTCVRVLRPNVSWIHAVAWSSDDSRLAAVSQDGTLLVWAIREDSDNGLVAEESYTRVTSERRPVLDVAWSHDDRFLVTAGVSPRVSVWNAANGHQVQPLRGHIESAVNVDWHPEHALFASASADGTVKIWAMESHMPGGPLEPAASPIRRVAPSPNGRWIAWRDVDGLVTVWDVQAKRKAITLSESVLGATGLAWHPDGSQLALARDNAVVVFSIPDGREIGRLEGHEGPVWSIAWDPMSDRIATGGNDRKLIVWRAKTGQQLLSLNDHDGDVRCVAWSHRGKFLATADTRGIVRIRDAAKGTIFRVLKCPTTSVNDLAWSPDDRLIAAATHEGAICRWSVNEGQIDTMLVGHQGDVWSVRWCADGRRLFSGGHDGAICVWDVATNHQLLQLAGHDGPVWSLDVTSDGRLYASGVDGTVRVWTID